MRAMRRLSTVVGALAFVAGGGLVAVAPAATAAEGDQVWYQAVASPSEKAPCPESSAEDLAKGWSTWVKGYEAWPNDGKGGWTCGRSILWAKGVQDGPVGPGCVQVLIDNRPSYGPNWMNFGSGFFLPDNSPAFHDPECTDFDFLSVGVVYATDPDLAQARCSAAVPGRRADHPTGLTPNVYRCYFLV